MPRTIPKRVQERVLSKVAMGPNGCHISTYKTNPGGYAVVTWRDDDTSKVAQGKAHRAAWIYHHGEIPAGMTVHHRCFTPRCVNVRHLELLTNLDNARRQQGVREIPDDGSCGRGHGPEFWVVVERRKGRDSYGCIECQRARKRAAHVRHREKNVARSRAYYAKNRDVLLVQQREYRARLKVGA